MTEGKKIAGRRRLRGVRLRPETTSGDGLRAMAQHLATMLGVGPERARGLLLQMGRSKHRAA